MSVTIQIIDILDQAPTTSAGDGHDLGHQTKALWTEAADWRAAVEDVVDTALNRVSAIELEKVLSWQS